VKYIELSPHNDSGASFFHFLNSETGIFKTEKVHIWLKQQWEDFLFIFEFFISLIIAEYKNILACRMSMHVTEKKYFAGL
jgi:hypothetical protein